MRYGLAFLFCFFGVVTNAKEVSLKWKAIEGATKYNLEISDKASFEESIFSKTVNQAHVNHDLKSGIYYLRVQSVDERGKKGPWSPPFKLVVTNPVTADQDETSKKVTFIEKAPEINSTWQTADTDQKTPTQFKVKVIKDGKEIFSRETSSAHINFKPEGPGEYKVVVSSGLKEYFGPPVTVSTFHVEKKNLQPPEWDVPENKKFNSRRPMVLSWKAAASAQSYRVKVFKAEDEAVRSPAALAENSGPKIVSPQDSSPVFSTDKLENTQIVIDPLPIGKYYAVVEAISTNGSDDGGDDGTAVTSTRLDLEVKRIKPVEFEKYDVAFKYNVLPGSYTANVYENGGTTSTSSVGGAVELDGNLWLPDSHWGVRAEGKWGGFTVQGSNITYNDLQAAAQYRLNPEDNFLQSEIKPFLGARAWTLPLILGQTNNGTSSAIVFPVILAGPLAGFEIAHAFSEKFAGVLLAQASFPVTNSSIGNQAASAVQADFGAPSFKVEVEAKYALPGTLRLVASAGFDEDQMQFSPFAGANASGPAPSGVKDSIKLASPTFSLGVEASDDGPLFRTTGTSPKRGDRFSDFDLSVRYAVQNVGYFANIIENSGYNMSAKNLGGNLVEFDGRGWFNQSLHGIRVAADWDNFSAQGASVNFPEYEVQWAFRPTVHPSSMGYSFSNFFGLKSWSVPILENTATSGQSNPPTAVGLFVRTPQLLGAAETFQISKGLSETWSLRFLGEISSPLVMADKDSTIDHVVPTDLSWNAQLQGVKTLSPDLSAGLGVGYSISQMTYVPSASSNNGTPINTSGTSYVQLTSPIISLFGAYSF